MLARDIISAMASSTGPLSDLRYMFRQTKEWRQAAEPAYMASPQRVSHMDHIGQHLHAHESQMSLLTC